jgi:hypothetical protein
MKYLPYLLAIIVLIGCSSKPTKPYHRCDEGVCDVHRDKTSIKFLICPKTNMINVSGIPWNKDDYAKLDKAKVRCGQLYRKQYCLVIFKKWREHGWSAICGLPKGL